MRWLVALAVTLVPVSASAADRSFAAAGTYDVTVEKVPQSTTQIAKPKGGGSHPLVIASHGFSANGDNQMGWAKHFASWGFVVAVPSFASSFSPDHQANAKVIAALVGDLGGNGIKVGLEGHSAGGLSTALAAVDVKPDAVVLFDPVDNSDLGKTASPNVVAPTLGIFAGPSACNMQAAWRSFVTTTNAPVLAFDVIGSTHCDGENAPRSLCAFGCGGGADSGRQGAYAHYATAFLLAILTGDAKAKTALLDAENDAELSGVIRTKTASGGLDAGAPDAAPPSGGPAGSSSSGGNAVPDPASNGNASPADDPVTTSEEGGGCAVEGRGYGTNGLLLAIVIAALAVVRRRHARG